MLQSSLAGHHDTIFRVMWLPDGRLFSVGMDATIRIWDGAHVDVAYCEHGFTSAAIASNGQQAFLTTWLSDYITVWDIEQKRIVDRWHGHQNIVNNCVVTPDGKSLITASDDCTVGVWDIESGQLRTRLDGHTNFVWSLAVTSKFVISGGADSTIIVWQLADGSQHRVWSGHAQWITALAVAPDEETVVAGMEDGSLLRWNLREAQLVERLDVHSGFINAIAFSPDGEWMATKSMDHSVRLWRTMDWTVAEVIDEPAYSGRDHYPHGLAFHPRKGQFATLGERDVVIRLWDLPAPPKQEFGVVKVVLMGQGVHEQPDRGIQLLHKLPEREAILWNLSHARDFRLMQRLALQDADLIALVFDITSWHTPLQIVEEHLEKLTNLPDTRKILISIRLGQGRSTVSRRDIMDFCAFHGIDEYVSAESNDLNATLIACLPAPAATTTRSVVDDMRRVIATQKDCASVRLSELTNQVPSFSEIGVKILAKYGEIILLGDANPLVVFDPNLISELASSLMLEARQNLMGLGALDEAKLHDNLPAIGNPVERTILLETVLNTLMDNNLCIRMHSGTKSLLVFPQLMQQRRPVGGDHEFQEDITYHLHDPIDHIYERMIVLLSYNSTLFTRTYHWDKQAQYEMGLGAVCGFEQHALPDGRIELVLTSTIATPSYSRSVFQGLFEQFLHQQGIVFERYPRLTCPNCHHIQDRTTVIGRITQGKNFIYCCECGEQLKLRDEPEHITPPRHPIPVGQAANLRNGFGNAIAKARRLAPNPNHQHSAFISYAWGNPEHEQWVTRLATHLQEADIDVVLDQWDNPEIGRSVARFISRIEQSDYIIVVGTPLFRKKYENKLSSTGSVVAAEVDLINIRLTGSEETKNTILPLLLEGNDRQSLPPLLQGRVFGDFREERFYFLSLFNLILTIYGVPSENPVIGALRKSVRAGAE